MAHQPENGRPLNDMPVEFREWLIDFGQSGHIALYRYDVFETITLACDIKKKLPIRDPLAYSVPQYDNPGAVLAGSYPVYNHQNG